MPPALTRPPVLALIAVVVAGVALMAATGSEKYLGLVPCALCLVERWPYRIALLCAAVALLPGRGWIGRIAMWGVVLCMAASVAAAAVHVGVEQGWWPSPLPECAAPSLGGGSIAERLARMPAQPAKPCDEPTYLIPFLPISMAAMNGLVALAFGAFLAKCLSTEPERSP